MAQKNHQYDSRLGVAACPHVLHTESNCLGPYIKPNTIPLVATALIHDLTIVTRNEKNFIKTRVKVKINNPFI